MSCLERKYEYIKSTSLVEGEDAILLYVVRATAAGLSQELAGDPK